MIPSTSWFYNYQSLLAGILALIAGVFALCVPLIVHWLDRLKTKREFAIRMHHFAAQVLYRANEVLEGDHEHPPRNAFSQIEALSTEFLTQDFFWSLTPAEAKEVARADMFFRITRAAIRDIYPTRDAIGSEGQYGKITRSICLAARSCRPFYDEAVPFFPDIVAYIESHPSPDDGGANIPSIFKDLSILVKKPDRVKGAKE